MKAWQQAGLTGVGFCVFGIWAARTFTYEYIGALTFALSELIGLLMLAMATRMRHELRGAGLRSEDGGGSV